MELIIEPFHSLPCELEVFTINGNTANYRDFGDVYDHNEEEKRVHCIYFDKRNLEYFIQDYINPTIIRGLIPTFNNEKDAKAVIDNPNFREILDLVYKS